MNHDSTPRINLWYVWRLYTAIHPKRSHVILGDIVWAHDETKQLLHGLADVVVSGYFLILFVHITRLFIECYSSWTPPTVQISSRI